MYGLLNRAVCDLTIETFGHEVWIKVLDRAGVDSDAFHAMEQYPDSVTYGLVGALCEETGLEAAQALEAFGEYWIKFTGAQGYADLLDASGDTLPEFLHNLDDLHTRVSLSFKNLKPPTFSVDRETEDSLTLHYYSHREALGPVMVGLLKGLGDRFNLAVTVDREIHPLTDSGLVHEAFHLRW
jgi:hypothetical protein